MQEKSGAPFDPFFPEFTSHKDQMIVLNPDVIGFVGIIRDSLSKPVIDVLVSIPI